MILSKCMNISIIIRISFAGFVKDKIQFLNIQIDKNHTNLYHKLTHTGLYKS